ncbi:hypothetical protein RKE30_20040 [Streptomyces sp. Li-HN-5-11]|uniref:hypothetical protein n=1 Tax=Streptomyces sp. Li-HN-5-11 TaxID=3075432 RepID=UPI0028ACD831|nr:hypothetical protein [Streptomyces sp. Li-HN-5-11]WNM32542.1 hypothetical protein RKE30_20040 [Streptomyces sp. Li-HN-5-11]
MGKAPLPLPLPLRMPAATPLILREQGSGTRDTLREFLRETGELVPPAAELGSTTAIKPRSSATSR